MAFPSNPTANQTFTTPAGSTYIFKNGSWNAQSGGSSGTVGGSSGTAASTNLTVTQAAVNLVLTNAHSGNIIECADGTNLDVPAGLVTGFNVSINLPSTGSVTVTPGVGVSINNQSLLITRSAINSILALLPTSTIDTYKLTGV